MSRLFEPWTAEAASLPGQVRASQRLDVADSTVPVGRPFQRQADALRARMSAGMNPLELQEPLLPYLETWASDAEISNARANASQRLTLSGSPNREIRYFPDPGHGPIVVRGIAEDVQAEPAYFAKLGLGLLVAVGGLWWLSRA